VFGPHGALESLRGICQGAGCSMVDAALGWLIAQPGVSCVIVGASSPEQMTRNAKLPRIDPAVAQQCSEATAALKELWPSKATLWISMLPNRASMAREGSPASRPLGF